MIQGIDNIGICTTGVARAVAFYKNWASLKLTVTTARADGGR
jgi:hypothetical protein